MISSLQRLHFCQIDTQSRTTTFCYFDVLFPKGNFRLKAMRKVLSVMVVGGKIWVQAGQCRRLACLIRQYNLYAERCCIDYWFHFLLKTLIFTFIFKNNLSDVYFLSQFFFIVLLHWSEDHVSPNFVCDAYGWWTNRIPASRSPGTFKPNWIPPNPLTNINYAFISMNIVVDSEH